MKHLLTPVESTGDLEGGPSLSRRQALGWMGVSLGLMCATPRASAQDVGAASAPPVEPFMLMTQRKLGSQQVLNALMVSHTGSVYTQPAISKVAALTRSAYPSANLRTARLPGAFLYVNRASRPGRLYVVDLAETDSGPVQQQLLVGRDVTDILDVQPLNREGSRHLVTVMADGTRVRLRFKGATPLAKVARAYVSEMAEVIRPFYNADGSLRGCLAKEGPWVLWFDAAAKARKNLLYGSGPSVISPIVERGVLDHGQTFVYSIGDSLYRFDAAALRLTYLCAAVGAWGRQLVALRDEAMVVRSGMLANQYSVVRTFALQRDSGTQVINDARDPARSLAVFPGGVAFAATDGRICFQGTNEAAPSASIAPLPDGKTFGRLVWGGENLYAVVMDGVRQVEVRRIRLEPTPVLDETFAVRADRVKFVYDPTRSYGVRVALGMTYPAWLELAPNQDRVRLRYYSFAEGRSVALGKMYAVDIDESDVDLHSPMLLWATVPTSVGQGDALYSFTTEEASLRRHKVWGR